MAIFSGFSHWKWRIFPVRYVQLPEGRESATIQWSLGSVRRGTSPCGCEWSGNGNHHLNWGQWKKFSRWVTLNVHHGKIHHAIQMEKKSMAILNGYVKLAEGNRNQNREARGSRWASMDINDRYDRNWSATERGSRTTCHNMAAFCRPNLNQLDHQINLTNTGWRDPCYHVFLLFSLLLWYQNRLSVFDLFVFIHFHPLLDP